MVMTMAGPSYGADRYGLEITGVPEHAQPVLAQRLHTALHYGAVHSVVTQPATTQWFWEPEPEELHIRVVFTRYYSGRKKKVLLPLVSARYSYEMEAVGMTAVYSPEGDSLFFRAPFKFEFEQPVSYQVIGINADLPAAQMSATTQHRLEAAAMDSLSAVIVRLIESGTRSPHGAP